MLPSSLVPDWAPGWLLVVSIVAAAVAFRDVEPAEYAGLFSNDDPLAEKLFVSDSTVRTHLRNINMKLAAQNRTQAVSLARRYGLIR